MFLIFNIYLIKYKSLYSTFQEKMQQIKCVQHKLRTNKTQDKQCPNSEFRRNDSRFVKCQEATANYTSPNLHARRLINISFAFWNFSGFLRIFSNCNWLNLQKHTGRTSKRKETKMNKTRERIPDFVFIIR